MWCSCAWNYKIIWNSRQLTLIKSIKWWINVIIFWTYQIEAPSESNVWLTDNLKTTLYIYDEPNGHSSMPHVFFFDSSLKSIKHPPRELGPVSLQDFLSWILVIWKILSSCQEYHVSFLNSQEFWNVASPNP